MLQKAPWLPSLSTPFSSGQDTFPPGWNEQIMLRWCFNCRSHFPLIKTKTYKKQVERKTIFKWFCCSCHGKCLFFEAQIKVSSPKRHHSWNATDPSAPSIFFFQALQLEEGLQQLRFQQIWEWEWVHLSKATLIQKNIIQFIAKHLKKLKSCIKEQPSPGAEPSPASAGKGNWKGWRGTAGINVTGRAELGFQLRHEPCNVWAAPWDQWGVEPGNSTPSKELLPGIQPCWRIQSSLKSRFLTINALPRSLQAMAPSSHAELHPFVR